MGGSGGNSQSDGGSGTNRGGRDGSIRVGGRANAAPSHVPPRAQVLGVEVDCVSPDEAVARCVEMVRSGRGGQVVTVNPEMVLACANDSQLAQAIAAADLVVPDGIGIVLGLRLLGYRVPGRVPGIELAEALMREATLARQSVFFVGAKPGIAEEAGRQISLKVSGLRIAGVRHGYFGADEEPQVLEAIGHAGPAYVFVGLGAGKQEKWIARARSASHGAYAPGAVWVGIGGSFDVMSGTLKRAPAAWQRLGLEWAYRLIQEPSRLRRMTALPVFAARVAMQAVTGRGNAHRRS
ncbi:MAG: putative N-acetylmannosaminyltransferase [Firmicutes bacterium ADurb.Bin506]|nr:MAG: putative N-acetylmannosaminyltransferase [Firmicutes bacterium ADurb.Bin506]